MNRPPATAPGRRTLSYGVLTLALAALGAAGGYRAAVSEPDLPEGRGSEEVVTQRSERHFAPRSAAETSRSDDGPLRSETRRNDAWTAPASYGGEPKQAQIAEAKTLARNAPLEALRRVQAWPAHERGEVVIVAAYELTRESPQEALAALATLAPTPGRDAAITHAVGEWTTIDPEAASRWAVQIGPSELREWVCGAVAVAWADRAPRAAAEFVAKQMGDDEALRIAAVAVVQRWAQQEPDAALDWVEHFEDIPLRDNARREIEIQRARFFPGRSR